MCRRRLKGTPKEFECVLLLLQSDEALANVFPGLQNKCSSFCLYSSVPATLNLSCESVSRGTTKAKLRYYFANDSQALQSCA